ncbi:MAG: Trk family potassium uptake protein [Clostridiales bacterium]|nr:Trk family potassium uptake protein [Clostridiales bacterium]
MRNRLQKATYSFSLFWGKLRRRFSPTRLVVLSFILVIFIGSLLLSLPFSHQKNAPAVSYIDCLFTAVSASCVTGLVTVTTATQWSVFGQLVILLMIQIGGLSFITLFTFLAVYLGKKINMKSRMAVQASLNQNNMQGMVRIVTMAIKGTLLFEFIGAVLLFFFFWLDYGVAPKTAAFWGAFHSVSSFCNAGFDIIGDNSLQHFVASPLVNITVMSLIILGGIGFTVWKDIHNNFKYFSTKKHGMWFHLSLHTKLALLSTLLLILFGTLYFFTTEFYNPLTLGSLSFGGKIWASFFHSISLRTAGFATINQNGLTESSKFVSSLFMLIGGSPGGTAGGIKTVTLAVIIASILATLKGRNDIDLFRRRIPRTSLQKAITVIGVMLALWFIVATILEFTESNSAFPYTFVDLLFEVSSALGTVGLSTGITPYMSPAGKFLLMLCMFVGRLGPISIAVALQRKLHTTSESDRIHYPEEDVIIG